MKICYVLAYRDPHYVRTRSILSALKQLPEVDVLEAINSRKGIGRYFETFQKIQEIRKAFDPDLYMLGFRGHEFYWPLRLLVGKKPIVLDAMMSPYASLSQERKFGIPGALAATAWRVVEKSVLTNADLVLTDTQQHLLFYQREFSLPPEKLVALPVGADERAEATAESPLEPNYDLERPMSILFYGSFLPLHGVETILAAATRVKDLPLRFDFVGGNKKQSRELKSNCARLGISKYTHRPWVSYDELVKETIPNADLCLGGPFGDTEQAKRVVTGKASQCLALGKPTVIGKIDEDTGFVDKENCLWVPQGNPDALADAIRWAFKHPAELRKIGKKGRATYVERLSIGEIRRRLQPALASLRAT